MKVLQLITGLGIGGAEKVVYDLCLASTKDASTTMEVAVLSNELDRLPEFKAISMPVHQLHIQKSIPAFWRAIKQLHQIIINGKFEVVHTHMFHAQLLMTFHNLFYQTIPTVFTAHSKDIEGKNRERLLSVTKFTRHHDILFSKDQKQFYHLNKTSIIPNGIDIQGIEARAQQPKQSTFTFINVARFNEAKNHSFLLKTVAKLKQANYTFQLWLIGDGELRNEIEAEIHELNLQNTVKLWGVRTDIPELLGQAHVFVLPSKWEGLPISVLEAGAANIPIIATPVGSLPDVLQQNRGVIASENEFYKEMENAINNYALHVEQASQLKNYLRKEYGISTVYQKHIELYKKLN